MNRTQNGTEEARHKTDAIDNDIDDAAVKPFRKLSDQPQRSDNQPQIEPVELQAFMGQVMQWSAAPFQSLCDPRRTDIESVCRGNPNQCQDRADSHHQHVGCVGVGFGEAGSVFQVVTVQMSRSGDQSDSQSGGRENEQWSGHRGRCVMRMITGLRGKSLLSPKCHEVGSKCIERSHQRCQQGYAQNDPIEVRVFARLTRGEQHRQNFIFAPEAGEQRETGEGQCSGKEGDVRNRQHLTQTAESSHIDHVTHGVHHRTGREEQHGLEEGVREHVEHGKGHGMRGQIQARPGRSQ